MRLCIAVYTRAPHESRRSLFAFLDFLLLGRSLHVPSIKCCELIDAATRCRYFASGYHMNKGSAWLTVILVLGFSLRGTLGSVRAFWLNIRP